MVSWQIITMTLHERLCIINHRLVRRNQKRLMDSLHKGPVMQKLVPRHDVIMYGLESLLPAEAYVKPALTSAWMGNYTHHNTPLPPKNEKRKRNLFVITYMIHAIITVNICWYELIPHDCLVFYIISNKYHIN